MPEGQVLEFNRVTKRFGAVTAVSDLSVRVEPGAVTGFLGPNGAGKTTSLRMLLGQIRPTSGTATIGGVSYSELRHPLRTVGAVLEEAAYRPRRTATRQLSIAAKANGIPLARVEEVLRLVGLQDDADTRLGSYSLGMRQRLGVATALLGDPGALVLDEPANGLDPEGIRWMRLLMRRLADEGRTVLVSSHVLSEIEQVADNVVVLSKGRAVYSGSMGDLADPSGGAVVVDAEDRSGLAAALRAEGLAFDVLRSGVTVRGSNAANVGAVAAAAGIALTTLQQRGPSLEEVFLDLVYGRRADSPRLDENANPVAHAPMTDEPAAMTGDVAVVAGGVPLAGAAALIADGGVVAAAGVGYGTAPITIIPSAQSEDAVESESADAAAADAVEGEGADAEQPVAVEGESSDAADAEPVVDAPLAEAAAEQAEGEQADGETTEAQHVDAEATDVADADEQQDAEPTDAADGQGEGDAHGEAEAADGEAEGAAHEHAEQDPADQADGETAQDDAEHVDGEGDAEQPTEEGEHTESDDAEQAEHGDAAPSDEQAEHTDAERNDEHGEHDEAEQDVTDEHAHGEEASHEGETSETDGEHAENDEDRQDNAGEHAQGEDESHDHESHDHEASESDAEQADADADAEHGDADTGNAQDDAPEASDDDVAGVEIFGDVETIEEATGEDAPSDDAETHDDAADASDENAETGVSVNHAEGDAQAEHSEDDENAEGDEHVADEASDLEDDADDAEASANADAWAPRSAGASDDDTDDERPGVLPLATQAVSIPPTTDQTSFTELITGIPMLQQGESTSDDDAPATEAISISGETPAHEDDDDSVDDAQDDPRLAAMRTSLSAAASRFFDGPAPDYPYFTRREAAEQRAAEQEASASEEGSSDEASGDEASENHDERPDA